MRHTENVRNITDYRAVDTGKYVTFEFDYVTTGGVKKTLKLAHCEADRIRAAVLGEIEMMGPERQRKSFWASLRRKR
jgi:hypothetical protein